jgi:uncharacterized protein DUF695
VRRPVRTALTIALLAVVAFLAVRRKRSRHAPVVPVGASHAVREADPIDAFWVWWSTAKGPLAEAIRARTLDQWVAPISDRVHAIAPGLSWELGPGVKSAHHLCVSSEGDARLRITAERWLARAPAPDATWEYYPSRQASQGDPKSTLRLGGVDLPYADLRFGLELDAIRRRVHVVVFHEKFGSLPESDRGTAVFLFLDDILGEDGVERWVGRARHTLNANEAGETRGALLEAVRGLAAAEEEVFTMLEMKDSEGRTNLAVVNLALKRVDHLLMESHVEIRIPYPTSGERGFYTESVGEELGEMEDALLDALGKEAVYVGHETGLGVRRIHLHVAPAGGAQRIIAEWERMYPTWSIETIAKADPQWEILARW